MRLAVRVARDVDGDRLRRCAMARKIGLSRQMIIASDEALSVAQASSEMVIVTDHLLAVMADSKLSISGLLRQFARRRAP